MHSRLLSVVAGVGLVLLLYLVAVLLVELTTFKQKVRLENLV